MTEELQGLGAEQGNFLAPCRQGGELLLLRGLQETVVVEVHQFLEVPVGFGRQPQITDGANPCLWCGNGGGHGAKSKTGLFCQ